MSNPYESPKAVDKQAQSQVGWAWLLLLLPSAVCGLMTIAVNKWITQIGFLHLFLAGLPTPALCGLAIGFAVSAYQNKTRWSIFLMIGQVLAVGVVYWWLREPFHNPFP